MDAANGLVLQIFVIRRDSDFGNDTVSSQPPFDLFLRWDINRNITFNNGLTGKRITLLHIIRRKPQRASAADISLRHLHRATTATSLSAAWLTDLNARDVRGISQQWCWWGLVTMAFAYLRE